MNNDLFNEVKIKVLQLAEQQGIPVYELLLQIQQEIHMDSLRRVLIGSSNNSCPRKMREYSYVKSFLKK